MSNSNLELNDLTKFRLDEINKIKDYLNAEIKERKDIVKKDVAFDYADTFYYTTYIVWRFKYCVTCNGCWNTCWNSWSIFNCNIYCNDWCSQKIIKYHKKKEEKT